MPIHELLNRIRWDAEFARGNFELGYFDRVEGRTNKETSNIQHRTPNIEKV